MAVAMEPVRVSAKSEITANVRTKIIIDCSRCVGWHAEDQMVRFVFSQLRALYSTLGRQKLDDLSSQRDNFSRYSILVMVRL